ncbi:MAG TPA: four helix bundle protein [Dehalococcoidales bacterium]
MVKSEYKSTGKRDLEERTLKFANDIVGFVERLPRTIPNNELVKQLVRSAGSIGANYIEANEALGKKDFLLRLRICRKEAKESVYWLKLIRVKTDIIVEQRDTLLQEATELTKIFGAIVTKLQPPENV